jgi:hypothetical protein
MAGLLATFVASFTGSALGIGVGGVLAWRYYIKPRMNKAGRSARIAARLHPPASSQVPTGTTPGFVRHMGDVTVGSVRYSGIKRRQV